MDKIKLKANAKINLTLDVLGKRPDGYHELEMIMHGITLSDTVTISKISSPRIELKTNLGFLPTDGRNLAHKAASYMIENFEIDGGVDIGIVKKIPVAAGLAGGSADCAAVIKGMNEIFELKLSLRDMMDIGLNFGSDVPYCIMGKTALAKGRGEILESIETKLKLHIVLVKPHFSVSTAEVYRGLNLSEVKSRPQTAEALKSVMSGDVLGVCSNLCNVLETYTLKKHPSLLEVKKELKNNGAINALMSGSGPTVFGIFESKETACAAADALREINPKRTVIYCESEI